MLSGEVEKEDGQARICSVPCDLRTHCACAKYCDLPDHLQPEYREGAAQASGDGDGNSGSDVLITLITVKILLVVIRVIKTSDPELPSPSPKFTASLESRCRDGR